MSDQRFIWGVVIAVVIGLAFYGTFAIASDGDSQTCPDGQALQAFSVNAGGDQLRANQPDLPEGYTIEDNVSGAGTDFTVTSSSDSVEIRSDGPVRLTVACR